MGNPLASNDSPIPGTQAEPPEKRDARQSLADEYTRQDLGPKTKTADAPARSTQRASNDTPEKSWEQKYEAVDALIRERYYPKERLAASNYYALEKRFTGTIKSEADYIAAIKAETKALNDPWTEFTTTAELDAQRAGSEDGNRSSGIWVKDKNGAPVIEALLWGYPAYHSDLRIGDKITAVNGKSVAGMSVTQIDAMLAGKKGDNLNIQFETPEGDKRSQDLTFVDHQEMHSTAQIVDDPKTGKNVLQLGMLSFDKDASDELEEAIKAIPKDKLDTVSGIVLDLRGNEGGFLPPILRTADMFVPKGDFFRIDDRDGSRTVQTTGFDESDYTLDAETRAMLRDRPLAILINGTTRSAPETFAAGMRERGRPCAIVGEQSFGKAIAFTNFDVPDGNLKLTFEELKTPKGGEWHGKGLAPDITVQNARGANAKDTQLEKAIEAVIAAKK